MTSPPVPASDHAALAAAAAGWRCAYVHIPFCRRRCPYCDFAVVAEGEAAGPDPEERYLEAVRAEIGMEEPWGPLDAVAFGGGTPSTLGVELLASLLDAIGRQHGLAPGAEVGIEVNPEDWSDRYGDELLAAGFTRLSFGVQSFDHAVLMALGRLHTPDQGAQAVVSARRLGFHSVNVDLIFGAPVETPRSWEETVDRALALETDHISAYALTVERGTELSRQVAAGAPRSPG